MKGCLGIVEHDKTRYAQSGELTAKLTAYGSGRSGHEHYLSFQVILHLVHPYLYLLAPEQVFYLYVAYAAKEVGSGSQLIDGGGKIELYVEISCKIYKTCLLCLGIGRICEQNAGKGTLMLYPHHILQIAEVMDSLAHQSGYVGSSLWRDKTHHLIVGGILQTGVDRHRLVAYAVDQHLLALHGMLFIFIIFVAHAL